MRLFGLIGYPLGHSFSKKYFEEKFVNENLQDCAFELFPIKEIAAFESLLEHNKNLNGLAVTIPYKETVMPFLTKCTTAAKEIGAVNCIQFEGEHTVGYNTDVIGFEKSLLPLLLPHQKKALILGTGGAAKAVEFVLRKIGIDYLLVSRNANNVNRIVYSDIDKKLMEEYSLIINCTPLGMSPKVDELPNIPYQFVTKQHLFYDLIYQPEKTLFLQEAEKRGAIIKNGFEMLLLQAEENWKIWNSALDKKQLSNDF